jgi:hypothetical protein
MVTTIGQDIETVFLRSICEKIFYKRVKIKNYTPSHHTGGIMWQQHEIVSWGHHKN